jgi:hypothetical protein
VSLALLIGCSLVLFVLLVRAIDANVLRRISRLGRELTSARQDQATRITVDKNDEITALEKELASTLAALTNLIEDNRTATGVAKKQAAAAVEASQAFQEKVAELEKFKRLTVDRELKMIELKRKLSEKTQKNVNPVNP